MHDDDKKVLTTIVITEIKTSNSSNYCGSETTVQ